MALVAQMVLVAPMLSALKGSPLSLILFFSDGACARQAMQGYCIACRAEGVGRGKWDLDVWTAPVCDACVVVILWQLRIASVSLWAAALRLPYPGSSSSHWAGSNCSYWSYIFCQGLC